MLQTEIVFTEFSVYNAIARDFYRELKQRFCIYYAKKGLGIAKKISIQ